MVRAAGGSVKTAALRLRAREGRIAAARRRCKGRATTLAPGGKAVAAEACAIVWEEICVLPPVRAESACSCAFAARVATCRCCWAAARPIWGP